MSDYSYDDLPYVQHYCGVESWYQNNQPAVVWPDGTREWWVNGELQFSKKIVKEAKIRRTIDYNWRLSGF